MGDTTTKQYSCENASYLYTPHKEWLFLNITYYLNYSKYKQSNSISYIYIELQMYFLEIIITLNHYIFLLRYPTERTFETNF